MVAMTFEEILSHFPGPRKPNGQGGFMVPCPAHDDTDPSLSISPGNGNGPLFKCFADCDTEAILAAVGMTWQDILPPKETTRRKSSSTGASRIVATYDYTDDAGVLLYQAVRYDPKDFKQRRPDPDHPGDWIWNLKGIPRVLYRLPDAKKAIAAGETVYSVEGEKDVDNLTKIGVTATCNVGGAGKWKPEYSEVLRGAQVIVIPDADEPGRKHASQVFDALRGIAENVKIVPLPGGGKDVSDWIAAGGTREKLESLVATVTSPTPEESAEKTAITKPPLFDDVGLALRTGGIPAPIWLVKGLIERGLILLFGPSGAGKSFIAMYLAFCVAAGGDFFGRKVERGPVIYICGEGRNGAYRRLAALKKNYRVNIPDGSLFLSRRAVTLDFASVDLLGEEIQAATAAAGRPPVLLVVDTLARSLVGDENLQKDMGEFVNAVEKVSAEFGCAALVVHHSGHSEDAKNRPRGSSVLIGALDSNIQCVDRVLTWKKTKDAPLPEPVRFALKKILLGKDEDGEEISSAVIVEAGEGTAPRASHIGLEDAERLAMETLVKLSAKGELRAGLYWVGLDEWRAEFVRFHCGDNKKSKYTAHLRSRKKLIKMGLVSIDNDYFAVICPEDVEKVLDLVMIGPLLEKAATSAMSESGPATL